MKVKGFILMVCIVMLCSCNQTVESLNSIDEGLDVDKGNLISDEPSKIEQEDIYESYDVHEKVVAFNLDKNAYLEYVEFINEDELLVIVDSPNISHEIFLTSLRENSSRLLYSGEFRGPVYRIISVDSEIFSLQCSDRLLTFNMNSFELVEEIEFPNIGIDGQISPDKKHITYQTADERNNGSLYRMVLNNVCNNSSQVLAENLSGSTIPQWSEDNKLLYLTVLPHLGRKITANIFDLTDGSTINIETNLLGYENYQGYWINDKQILIYSPTATFGLSDNDEFLVIDIGDNSTEKILIKGQTQIWDVTEDGILYISYVRNNHTVSVRLNFYNYESKENLEISDLFSSIDTARLNSDSRRVVLIGKSGVDVDKSKIYLLDVFV